MQARGEVAKGEKRSEGNEGSEGGGEGEQSVFYTRF